MPNFEPGTPVKAQGWYGIAFRVIGEETEPTEETVWTGYETPTGRILTHMIGDDRTMPFDPTELTEVDDSEFCSGCGQFGHSNEFE